MALTPLLCLGLVLTGCATTQTKSAQRASDQQQLEDLTERLEEVERTNGRITVRMEDLEDQLFLLNDRVESHRLALQRRDYQPDSPRHYASRGQGAALSQPPQPAPETSYYEGAAPSRDVQRASPQRPVKRIRLSRSQEDTSTASMEAAQASSAPATEEEPYEEVVISEEQYRAFFGEEEAAPTSSPLSNAPRRAQPAVTDERLSSSTPAVSSKKKRSAAATDSPLKSTGLRLYKDALSAYRAGNYQRALEGFESFLAAQPKPDYVDNALYWIGECHYGLGHLDQAVSYFERVLTEQPDGNKVPDAMLKMSIALEKQGRVELSRQVIQDLIGQYPQTHAADLGAKRLAP